MSPRISRGYRSGALVEGFPHLRDVGQLVARLFWVQEAGGSSPPVPTRAALSKTGGGPHSHRKEKRVLDWLDWKPTRKTGLSAEEKGNPEFEAAAVSPQTAEAFLVAQGQNYDPAISYVLIHDKGAKKLRMLSSRVFVTHYENNGVVPEHPLCPEEWHGRGYAPIPPEAWPKEGYVYVRGLVLGKAVEGYGQVFVGDADGEKHLQIYPLGESVPKYLFPSSESLVFAIASK